MVLQEQPGSVEKRAQGWRWVVAYWEPGSGTEDLCGWQLAGQARPESRLSWLPLELPADPSLLREAKAVAERHVGPCEWFEYHHSGDPTMAVAAIGLPAQRRTISDATDPLTSDATDCLTEDEPADTA